MKYRKLFAKAFERNSGNDAAVATALVAGLAVGAVLAVLFAPDSGRNTRRKIGEQGGSLTDAIKDLTNSLKTKITGAAEQAEEAVSNNEVPHYTKQTQKKPKSDIKEIIHEAHAGDNQNQDQTQEQEQQQQG
ncbi:YtxH domain-containing protein [Pedobacter sp. SYP-B3415]|uniref:YtxH domain-containing protein n=1 Tax=Pedobacter sp. SYP-B3415 TaxID=2496641 RepID=UPI00101D6C60|nr:YtxH domain-containing protein [Pedobacter sp. SYP-B3415]